MKEMLFLCSKNFNFSYNQDIYIQKDVVAMGSPLGPVLAGLLVVNLENSLVSKLNIYINFSRRYVDDTIIFVKIGSVQSFLSVLNKFHLRIKFTYEMEVESKSGTITIIFGKVINNDVCLKLVFFLYKGMETRNIQINGSTSLYHLFIIPFTERKTKIFRRCSFYKKQLSRMGC